MSKQSWTDKETVTFLAQLEQVVHWTEKLSYGFDPASASYGTIFRTTHPTINGIELYSFKGGDAKWNLNDLDTSIYEALLDLAIKTRDKSYQASLGKFGDFGRVLSFETCISTNDGAPIAESRSFVDESDVPPIDTWFYLKNDYYHSEHLCKQVLFCWIPKQFEDLMQQTIDVEILDSYRWLDENDPYMSGILKQLS